MERATTNILYQQVLVLNASYEPVNICGAKRAIVLIVKGVAKSEEDSASIARSTSVEIKVPSVIRLVTFVNVFFILVIKICSVCSPRWIINPTG